MCSRVDPPLFDRVKNVGGLDGISKWERINERRFAQHRNDHNASKSQPRLPLHYVLKNGEFAGVPHNDAFARARFCEHD